MDHSTCFEHNSSIIRVLDIRIHAFLFNCVCNKTVWQEAAGVLAHYSFPTQPLTHCNCIGLLVTTQFVSSHLHCCACMHAKQSPATQ